VLFTTANEPQLAAVPGLSLGVLSATQGRYERAQLLLDLTQGARVSSSIYATSAPPPLALRGTGAGVAVLGWAAARRRAADVPQLLTPGLLAGSVPGGGAYAGTTLADGLDGVLAADRSGRIAAVSTGSPATLPARIAALLASRRLVVADLPGGPVGLAELRALAAGRPAGELLLALQRADGAGHELLWSGAAGLAQGRRGELTSQSTQERGLVSAVDLAPTILAHLGLRPPAQMRGTDIHAQGPLDSAGLRGLMARLRSIGGRRLRALAFLLSAWALLLLLCARDARARAWALRVGALAVLWAPVAVLIPAPLSPSPPVEHALIVAACLLLGALADRLLAWPRAPLAPALAAVALLSFDALAHTQLLVRSLLGPDPRLGARFYGIGNELKSGLAVLVLAAVAAALHPGARGRRAVGWTVGAGVVLALVEGSARIGAGVGGVILVSAGFAVAAAMLLPGTLNRRRALIVLAAPLLGLVALAALDLATAHGGGHYTGSILHARSATDLRDVLVRRYTAAWQELHNHAMPAASAVALACALLGLRLRRRLLAHVGGDPVWLAALAGGLAAGLVGALVEDSGPVLLVVAVFCLGCVASYIGAPPRTEGPRSADLLAAPTAVLAGKRD
jgi:hypothetical protein